MGSNLSPHISWNGTQLRKSFKDIKSRNKLSNVFRFKDSIPKAFGVVWKFQCGITNKYYHSAYVRLLNVSTREHIGISSLTKKNVKSNSVDSDQF